MKINFLRNSEHTMIFFGKILLKTLYFFITNISELDFEEKKSAEIVLHPMHGGGGPSIAQYYISLYLGWEMINTEIQI